MQFTTTLQKAYKLEANATGMGTTKTQFFFLEFRKTLRHAKYNKKLIIDDKEATDQACILDHIKDFYETLLKKRKQKLWPK